MFYNKVFLSFFLKLIKFITIFTIIIIVAFTAISNNHSIFQGFLSEFIIRLSVKYSNQFSFTMWTFHINQYINDES